MSRAKDLYELQLVDLEIDAKTEALANVESQLGETEELIAAREVYQEVQERIAALEKRRKSLEYDVEDLQGKIGPEETKLYSGTVKNPKELASMQQEVDLLKGRKRRLEDEELEIMTETEEVEADRQAKGAELARVEGEWRENQGSLLAEQADLEKQLGALQAKREAALRFVDAASLQIYETLRPAKRGMAVAKVERGMCQGCRISLPTTEVQRVRSSPGLVQCSSCARILYLS